MKFKLVEEGTVQEFNDDTFQPLKYIFKRGVRMYPNYVGAVARRTLYLFPLNYSIGPEGEKVDSTLLHVTLIDGVLTLVYLMKSLDVNIVHFSLNTLTPQDYLVGKWRLKTFLNEL